MVKIQVILDENDAKEIGKSWDKVFDGLKTKEFIEELEQYKQGNEPPKIIGNFNDVLYKKIFDYFEGD